MDTWFNHPRYTLLNARLDAALIPTPELGGLLESIAGGATPSRSDDSLYAGGGVRFFRILNVDDGEIVERDLKFVTDDVHNRLLERSRLAAGDVLMTITGRVGSAAVVSEEHLPANINQHIARLRVDPQRCRPEFLSEWLNCPAGLELSNRYVSGGTRVALDYGAIRSLRVLLPSLATQDALVDAMASARAERQEKLAEADALLAGIDDFLLDALGIAPPAEETRRAFAVRGQFAANRIDPHFHSPDFARIGQMLSQVHCEYLGNVATLSKETWSPQDHQDLTFRYIEISTVSPRTGKADWNEVPTSEAPSRARMQVRADDIIISLTRPHHGSIAHLGPEFDGCIASTGFAVIRNVAEHVNREYLWCILRAKFCLQQMLQRASGGNYPAIMEPELEKILIPVPDSITQSYIAAKVRQRQNAARQLRDEAEAGWAAAKGRFEVQLLSTLKIAR